MKKFVLFVLPVILLMAMLLAGCQQGRTSPVASPSKPTTIETQGNSKTYSNYQYGFSFSTCNNKDFEVSENYQGAVFALLGPFLRDMKHQMGIFMIIDKLSKNTKLEDYLQAHKKEGERTLANFAITNESAITIGGVPAKLISFTFTLNIEDEEYAYKDLLAVFVKGNNIYAIKYDVPAEFHDQYIDCFNLILPSFKFQ